MPELCSPAGSAEAIAAAVQSGADAVYVSLRGAVGSSRYDISEEEFGRAAEFCRIRGVKLYAKVELSPFDEEFAAAVETALQAWRLGADALIVHDLGLIWALRRALPEARIHAGPKLGIHNLDGLRMMAAMGVSRVSLSPDLPREEVEELCRVSPVELEVAVHGRICADCSGACLLPALSGEESAFRTLCPGLCEEFFQVDAPRRGAPFADDELCLAGWLRELAGMGIAALRIEGRDRRPEYVAAVTGVYTRLLGTDSRPTMEDVDILVRAHPAQGFSDGTFGGGRQRFAGSSALPSESFFASLRKSYLNREFQRVPVDFSGCVRMGQPFSLTASDRDGHSAAAEGPMPELAFHRELDSAMLTTELAHTGGTPFLCGHVRFDIERGLTLPAKDIGAARDQALHELMGKRSEPALRHSGRVELPPRTPNSGEPPVLTVFLQRRSQLSARLLELAPPVIYLPLKEIICAGEELEPFLQSEYVSVCAALPPFVLDGELEKLSADLEKAWSLGVREVLAGNLGHLLFAQRFGFGVRGDIALNVRNSAALYAMSGFRLKSAALSPELGPARVRAISKGVPAELAVYGRMPVIVTDRCVIKNVLGTCSCDGFTGLADRAGLVHPVTRDARCGNTVWSAKKLFLAGQSHDYMNSGLWGVRLMFTTESAGECALLAERYLELGSYEPVSFRTWLTGGE